LLVPAVFGKIRADSLVEFVAHINACRTCNLNFQEEVMNQQLIILAKSQGKSVPHIKEIVGPLSEQTYSRMMTFTVQQDMIIPLPVSFN
jgi:hypothetical protein